MTGFEPATTRPPGVYSTGLSYIPFTRRSFPACRALAGRSEGGFFISLSEGGFFISLSKGRYSISFSEGGFFISLSKGSFFIFEVGNTGFEPVTSHV